MPQIPRLYLPQNLTLDGEFILEDKQFHYITNVLRKTKGDEFYSFNGKDGEFLCVIIDKLKKQLVAKALKKTKEQTKPYKLHYLFAPLKKERLDYIMQKATEMGAGIIQPVITEYTQIKKLNYDRLKANTIEAVEQCGILNIPKIEKEQTFYRLLDYWDEEKILIFCDEFCLSNNDKYNINAPQNKIQPLNSIQLITKRFNELRQRKKNEELAVIIGPEGGFSDNERKKLYEKDYVLPISLGPRIMRADTAAVAALSLIQSLFGDWYP